MVAIVRKKQSSNFGRYVCAYFLFFQKTQQFSWFSSIFETIAPDVMWFSNTEKQSESINIVKKSGF